MTASRTGHGRQSGVLDSNPLLFYCTRPEGSTSQFIGIVKRPTTPPTYFRAALTTRNVSETGSRYNGLNSGPASAAMVGEPSDAI